MLAPCALLIAGLIFSAPQPEPAEDPAFADILRFEDTRSAGPGLLSYLAADRPLAVRLRAALALGRIGSPVATPYDLLGALADPAPELRRMAVFSVGEMDDPRGATLLAASLRDADASVRGLAAEGLGKLKDPSSAPALVAALEDADPEVVGLAFLALWRLDTGGLLPRVIERASMLSRSPDRTLRGRAVYFLMRTQIAHPEEKPVEAALLAASAQSDPLLRSWAARGLGASLSPAATGALLALAVDVDPHVRINAFNGLKARPMKDGCARHLEALAGSGAQGRGAGRRERNSKDDGDPAGVRLAALAALESCGDESSRRHLVESLAAPHPRFREVAALALSAREKAGAIAAILPLADDPVWSVRGRAAEALGLILAASGSEAAGAPMAQALGAMERLGSDPDPRIRLATAEAWGKLASPAAAAARLRFLEDADPYVRAAAMDATGGHLPDDPAARGALVERLAEGFLKARSDTANDARLAALASLARAGGGAARAVLEDALGDADALVRRRAADLLKQSFDMDRFASLSGPPASRDQEGYLEAVRRSRRGVTARIDTEAGLIELRLFPADAPLTVDNFIRLAREGRYDNLAFHRVVPNFVVQDGDPRGDGNGGPPWQIRCEINPRRYGTGSLGMALSGKDTGGSQYFITHSPQPHLDGGYTVFGEVVSGQEAVDRLVQGDRIRSIRVSEEPADRR